MARNDQYPFNSGAAFPILVNAGDWERPWIREYFTRCHPCGAGTESVFAESVPPASPVAHSSCRKLRSPCSLPQPAIQKSTRSFHQWWVAVPATTARGRYAYTWGHSPRVLQSSYRVETLGP